MSPRAYFVQVHAPEGGVVAKRRPASDPMYVLKGHHAAIATRGLPDVFPFAHREMLKLSQNAIVDAESMLDGKIASVM